MRLPQLVLLFKMRAARIPKLIRNAVDGSVTISYQQPKYTLLWLHGLGDRPDSYIPYFTHHLSPLYEGCRVKIIPAPVRNLSLTQSEEAAWFDPAIVSSQSKENSQGIDTAQIEDSHSYVNNFFQEEVSFWKESSEKIAPNHRIYVGGMGQGAAMALHFAFTNSPVPAGVLSLSGYLLQQTALTNMRKMPALLVHGHKDQTIREIQARKSYTQLLKDEFLVQYKTLDDLQHGVNLQQLKMMSEWLKESHEFIRKHYESS